MRMKFMFLLALVCVAFGNFGCANTMKAIENRELKVDAKMSESIFLDAESLAGALKGSPGSIYVRAANTSDFQEVDFGQIIKTKLESLGYNVTSDPRIATIQVTANLLYLNEAKAGMSVQSVIGSGFGGAVLGAGVAGLTGSSWRGAGQAGLAVGLVSGVADGAAGMMFKVSEYIGVTDIQIKEAVEGGVEGTQVANVTNGSSTTTSTVRAIKTDKQEYRTRIVVSARQTNIKREEATPVISDRLGSQISGLFKM